MTPHDPMDGPELMRVLTILGWQQAELAARLGISTETVRRMVRGQGRVPADLAAALRGAAAWVEAYPLPRWVNGSTLRHVRGKYRPRKRPADG